MIKRCRFSIISLNPNILLLQIQSWKLVYIALIKKMCKKCRGGSMTMRVQYASSKDTLPTKAHILLSYTNYCAFSVHLLLLFFVNV